MCGRMSPDDFESSFLARLGAYDEIRKQIRQQEKQDLKKYVLHHTVRL